MHIWSSPELYVSVVAVIGVAILAIYLTAPGREKTKERKRQLRDGDGRDASGRTSPASAAGSPARETFRSQGGHAMGGAASIGPVPVAAAREATRFTDLAGLDEAITELSEVREYLSDPTRFEAVGAQLPRGILLYGPPGCGKTLLARALAGETGVPFYSVSAASFVEQMVGLGSARVRQLFDEARKAAPSIVFLDELDAIGRSRDNNNSGGREFDHTLNQLLVELDGFGGTTGVLLIGATNRPELIDSALLRPGRFDRRISVERPDRKGREQILRLHADRRPVSPMVNWAEVAADTSGLNGAELANIVNEGALLAARRHQEWIEAENVWEAVARVVAGTGSERLIRDDERHLRATHEAGHALLTLLLRGMRPPSRVSIVSRKGAFDRSPWSTAEDRETLTKRELMAQLIVLLGGRAAEIHTFGEPSTRAEDDLQHAAALARRMVEKWAMTGRFELAGGESDKKMPYLEGSAGGSEVRTLVSGAEQAARTILADNERSLRLIATTLADRESLTASELAELHMNGATFGSGSGLSRVRLNRPGIIDLRSDSGSSDGAGISPSGSVGPSAQPHGGLFDDPDF
ncbi:MAG: cell division protease FtsH [Acidimicrobiaceae bacterium]|jgi:cell division protease FtsH|nr:cell division protease FtsH [Acidimicrobiaceae bacterium]MDQ1415760.1 cell division protease FtsH [Acidimicrobiaceae bacterium]